MIQKICHYLLFDLMGWKLQGNLPENLNNHLFVMVPHTSNWDFVTGWLAMRALELDVKIFVKDAFFIWPLNYVCKFFGVAPVNRRESTNFVDAVARQYRESDYLAALITPEGTRKKVESLKSGYYYLAKKAGVPIVQAGLNYRDRLLVLTDAREPMPTFEEDVEVLRDFSQKMVGKRDHLSFE
ncbi:MAG: hypothetical protein HKN50_00870 [Gammaproteobacteria bacterium]|nr:hypothetical protein [Gammaproteobacteria bacterium]